MKWVVGPVLVAAVALGIYAWLSRADEPADPSLPAAPADPGRLQVATPPAIQFTEITDDSGITFVHHGGASGDRLLPETMGGSVAVLDFDGDAQPDLLFGGGRAWPWDGQEAPETPSLVLYRGLGGGRFEEVDAGLPQDRYVMSVSAADYDGDGWTDLYVAALGPDVLLQNQSGKRFDDVTEAAALAARDEWSAGAAFVDVDGDDWLDLVVTPYVRWSRELDFEVDYRLAGVGRAYGPPLNYAGTQTRLYRNLGGGSFDDVTDDSGLTVNHPVSGEPVGKGLALLPADLDEDGDVDLFVANDTVANFWFENDGAGRFREIGAEVGLAFDNAGVATGAMGVDRAWLSDGSPVVAVANFANEMTSVYVSTEGLFADEAVSLGIGPATRRALSFGLLFLDADLDGRVDLLQANGHVEPEIARVQRSQRYRQAPQLFWQCGADCERWFFPVEAGDLTRVTLAGRGAAYLDFDDDGDQDVVIAQVGDRPRLFRNDTPRSGDWLRVLLRQAGGNRRSLGARIILTTSSGIQRREVTPTRSYLSQVELPVTFGLGTAQPVSLTVHWPDGTVSEHGDLPINRQIEIRKPTPRQR